MPKGKIMKFKFIAIAAIKEYLMKAGDMMVFPANVPHEFHFTEDTIDVDFFAPARQDWIDGTADYIKQ